MTPEVQFEAIAASADELERALAAVGYIADERTVMAAWLALSLGRPLLLEGPPGVGKTELGRSLARALGRELVRLQCYEGLDEARALYDWDYGKQMLFTQLLRAPIDEVAERGTSLREAAERLESAEARDVFFSERFLVARPVLRALRAPHATVLLVDELDRAEPELEALLLEVLAEGQVTIPELGAVRGTHPMLAILTSNATRELSDALRRRCVHAFLTYPSPARELAIVERQVPGAPRALLESLVGFVSRARALELRQAPSIAEIVDWARALTTLGASALDAALVERTAAALVKHEEDREAVLQLATRRDAFAPAGAAEKR